MKEKETCSTAKRFNMEEEEKVLKAWKRGDDGRGTFRGGGGFSRA